MTNTTTTTECSYCNSPAVGDDEDGDPTCDDAETCMPCFPSPRLADPTWSPSNAVCDAVLDVEWGSVEQYYPEADCRPLRGDWDRCGLDWAVAIDRALNAETREKALDALDEASRIERSWGDDPSTQKVRNILGLKVVR